MQYDPNDPYGFRKQRFSILDVDYIQRSLMEQLPLAEREFLKKHFHTGSTRTASSTSGEVPVKQVPKADEQWWVKYPDQPRLVLIEVKEISGASVLIHVEGHHLLLGLRAGRYERDYLKFVEKYVQPSLEPKPV